MAARHQRKGHHIAAVRQPSLTPPFLETNSFRSQPSGAQNQAEALRAEGVTVTENAMGELSVDFKDFGWFPEDLPSIAAEEGS